MTITQEERKETTEELEKEFAAKRQHPAVLVQRAVEAGDLELANVIAEAGWHHLTGREKVLLVNFIKAHNPESTEEYLVRA